MKTALLTIISGLFLSCSRPAQKFNDDYVLIEFAAKLEGQYHAPKEIQGPQVYQHHEENMQKPYDPPVENEILLEDLDNN